MRPRWLPAALVTLLSAGLLTGPALPSVTRPAGPSSEVAAAFAEARRTGRPAEIPSWGTATTRYLAEPGGRLNAQISSGPAFVRRDGRWVPIDTTLRRTGEGISPVAAGEVVLSPGGTGPLTRLRTPAGDLAVTWPGTLPAPVLDGDRATYPEVRAGVDLTLRATRSDVSTVLTVKTPEALKALPDLRFGVTGTREPAPRAWVWDSAAGPADRIASPKPGDHVSDLKAAYEPGSITLSPAGLTGTFPLHIGLAYAPGTHLNHWTLLSEQDPGTPRWDTSWLAKVGAASDGINAPKYYRSSFELNTTALAGARIMKAELRAGAQWSVSCVQRPVEVWHVPRFDAATTWANKGIDGNRVTGRDLALGWSTACQRGNVEFDITGVVATNAAGKNPDLTLSLRTPETDRYNAGAMEFDNVVTLDVKYNVPPGAPAGLSTGSKACGEHGGLAAPELRATIDDQQDDDLGQVSAVFEWWTAGAGTRVSEGRTVPMSGGSTFRWTGPALPDGAYQWRVRGDDGIDPGAWSEWCPATVDTKAPLLVPSIASAEYPEGETGGAPYQPGQFTFSSGEAGVAGYVYGLNSDPSILVPAGPTGTATAEITPDASATQALNVRAVDRAGNRGPLRIYEFTPLPPDPSTLRAHWQLDEGYGEWLMDATYQNPATLYAGTAWEAEGRPSTSVRFDGTPGGARTEAPATRSDESFTVMAWVRLDDDSEWRTAVSQGGQKHLGFELQYSSYPRGWSFQMRQSDEDNAASDTIISPNTAVAKGVWTHLAGVFDAETSQMRLYVNGKLAGTAQHTARWYADGPFAFGYRNYYGYQPTRWLGLLDDVRVFSRPVPEREIGGVIKETLGSLAFTSGGQWNLDEDAGPAADGTGHEHTITTRAGVSRTDGPPGRGKALLFDGTDKGFAATTGSVLDTSRSFTVSARVRLDKTTGTAKALSQDGATHSGFSLGYSSQTRSWMFETSGAGSAATVTPAAWHAAQPGLWTLLTGVYDHEQGEARLYVNGKLAAAAPGRTTGTATGAFQLGRGKNNGWIVDFWPGAIDDVLATDRVVPAAEIWDWQKQTGALLGPEGSWEFTGVRPGGCPGDSLAPCPKTSPGNGSQASQDGTGNGHSMAFAGGVEYEPGGSGLVFNGQDGHAYTAGPVAAVPQGFTAAAWVRVNPGTSGLRTVLSQDGKRNSGFVLEYDGTAQRWRFRVTSKDADGTVYAVAVSREVAETGKWAHVIGVYDHVAKQARLYVNGSLAGQASHEVTQPVLGAFQVGRSVVDGRAAQFFAGAIDTVKVLGRPATATDIRNLTGLPERPAPGPYRFVSAQSGYCMDIDGPAGKGIVPSTSLCSDLDAQFALDQLPGGSSYRILVTRPGKLDVSCLAVASTTLGETVREETCSRDSAPHAVRLIPMTGGTQAFQIRQASGSWCLTVGAGPELGSHIVLGYCSGAGTFIFRPSSTTVTDPEGAPLPLPGTGRSKITAAHTGLCLAERPGVDDGLVYQASCTGAMPVYDLDLVQDFPKVYQFKPMHPVHGPGCLGVQGGSASAGAPVEDSFCGESTGNRMTLEAVTSPLRGFRIRAEHSGLCLGFAGNATAEWTQLTQQACDPAARGQVFGIEVDKGPDPPEAPSAAEPVRIRNLLTGECLTENPSDQYSGTIYPGLCDGAYPKLSLEKVFHSGAYVIRAEHPAQGKGCMGVAGASEEPGARVENTRYCTPGDHQMFLFEPVSAPARGFRIRPVHTYGCLTAAGSGRTYPYGNQVTHDECTPGAMEQVFAVEAAPPAPPSGAPKNPKTITVPVSGLRTIVYGSYLGSDTAMVAYVYGKPYRTLMKFELGAAAGRPIVSASLRLTSRSGVHGCQASQGIIAQRITGEWDQRQVYWGVQPGATTSGERVSRDPSACQENAQWTWDVTTMTRAWSAGTANHGVMLRAAEETGSDWSRTFHPDTAQGGPAAALVITYDAG
ncbi:LamG-like jellyroll fold domain-containing protein [Longispora albida]|uniref:LamG-like jellyroll fold domain-containing protein n=1 Tax=Longispora albida TaxID=203523 RepID=UPI0003814BAB|nr:LamG-like jellyroll fold domain-containing protein [Longispora albida]